MPAPKRRGELGTEQAVLDDLVLARDAGGLARCGADRLRGTLYLLYGGSDWHVEQVEEARVRLASEVRLACADYGALHRGDPCAQAASASLSAILLQEPPEEQPAVVLRRRAREAHGCYLADDSLRKREQPIMRLIAKNAYGGLTGQQRELMVSRDAVMQVLRPFAELAAHHVEVATKFFSRRAALHDDSYLWRATAEAIWAIAQFGVLPVYGLQRLEAMGARRGGDLTDISIIWLLEGIISVPFDREPGDLEQLATAIQPGEDPEGFCDRLLLTPVMRPVVRRLITWLASHDPKVCLYDSNDVMIGYCGPHYYVALCESWVDAANDYASGELTRDLEAMWRAIPFSDRARRRPPQAR
ncbi:MAG: hypothetical protein ACJ74O_06100 [Frankiaceae bacterium]